MRSITWLIFILGLIAVIKAENTKDEIGRKRNMIARVMKRAAFSNMISRVMRSDPDLYNSYLEDLSVSAIVLKKTVSRVQKIHFQSCLRYESDESRKLNKKKWCYFAYSLR